jgi:hypothetical protein
MLHLILLAGLAPAVAQPAATVTRSVTVGVCTRKAEPVTDLQAAEVVVVEGGRKAPALSVELDTRPVEVALVVDSSSAAASAYRSDFVSAVVGFWKGLPAGSTVAVWTSGPPSRVVDFGEDLASAEPKLQAVAPGGKNYAFDALVDACRALGSRAGERRVVVYAGGADMEASQVRTAEAMRAIGQAAATPLVVLVLPGGAGAAMGGPTSGSSFSWDVQGYFERMASGYRGASWTVLSTQAVEKSLQEAAAQLATQYRVRYAGAAGDAPPPRVEIRRKGVKALVGRTQVEVAKID